jgi:NitT/TauT family transport system permease protein
MKKIFKNSFLNSLLGFAVVIIIWQLIIITFGFSKFILPSPMDVLRAFKPLVLEYKLLQSVFASFKLNMWAYLESISLSLIVGFLIGSNKYTREMFQKPIDSLRYLPISALLGVFIAWFKIGDFMKIQFLSFAIFVYLVPALVARIKFADSDSTLVDTARSLGATKLQIFFKVKLPMVIPYFFEDIINLTAISWTYIIMTEMVNPENVLGALIYKM